MGNRDLLGIRRMDSLKCMDKAIVQIDEGILQWFAHVKRMENKIAKRVNVGECAGSCSVGRPQKRWIVAVKDCLKERGLDTRQARRIVHDRGL